MNRYLAGFLLVVGALCAPREGKRGRIRPQRGPREFQQEPGLPLLGGKEAMEKIRELLIS